MCLMLFWLLDPKANIMTPIFVIGINARVQPCRATLI